MELAQQATGVVLAQRLFVLAAVFCYDQHADNGCLLTASTRLSDWLSCRAGSVWRYASVFFGYNLDTRRSTRPSVSQWPISRPRRGLLNAVQA